MIGYLSDRYYRRTGTRTPFILTGALLFIISSYFLYIPVGIDTALLSSRDLRTADVSIFYFITWFLLFYLAWTLFEMPHLAWASKIANSSADKVRIYGYRNIASTLGLFIFFCIPLLPIFKDKNITPYTLEISVTSACLLMLPAIIACIAFVPKNSNSTTVEQNTTTKPSTIRTDLALLWYSLRHNKPLLIFTIIFTSILLSSSLWSSLLFLFVDTYLGQGHVFAKVYIVALIMSMLATPVWCKLALVLGKKKTCILASILLLGCFVYTGLLTPENASGIHIFAINLLMATGQACIATMAPAMLSEVIDYTSWKFGVESSATYFSLYMFMVKTSIALASALGLSLTGLYGYDATAYAHGHETTTGLIMAISWIPIVLIGIGATCVALFPINNRRHKIILQRLNTRSAAASTSQS